MFNFQIVTATSVIATMLSSSMAQYSGTSNATSAPTPRTVSFLSGNDWVVGHLYLPENYEHTHRYPAVAVSGPFSSVKEMMGGIYAGELARHGVMAVAIDYRNMAKVAAHSDNSKIPCPRLRISRLP